VGRACRALAAVALLLATAVASAAAAGPRELVPPSIDATGRVDVTTALRRFVDSVPDGTTIQLRPGGVYRIDGTLELSDRTGLTLDGAGARLVAGSHGGPTRAHLRLVGGRHWTIRNLTVIGANGAGGRFVPAYQWQHGIDLRGVDGATLDHVRVADVLGDAIYVGLSFVGSQWSRDVAIVDSTGERTGRQSIAITAGRHVTVRGGRWSAPGLSVFDIEPNGPGGAEDIRIEHTTIGWGAVVPTVSITGRGPIANVTLSGNVLIGRPLSVRVDQTSERPRNIVIRDNRALVVYGGPPPAAMFFRNADGVVVTRNRQPLAPGIALVATEGSSRVTVSDRPYVALSRGEHCRLCIAGALAAALVVLVILALVAARRPAAFRRPIDRP
jgi:hypothetical protein